MAQLEHTTGRTMTLAPRMVAIVATAVIAVAILLVMLIPSRVSPTTEAGQEISPANPALVEAGREWQRQRELEGGFINPLTQAERDWEQQRKQQSPFDGE